MDEQIGTEPFLESRYLLTTLPYIHGITGDAKLVWNIDIDDRGKLLWI